ncbi:MAG: 3-deoxy-D-manno-octulosonic acid transferase, partial [Bacteroidetes bacterium]|nr:3-deoxy-D-manno-octulosonic acid transferase [Bacteroidota bacterium]
IQEIEAFKKDRLCLIGGSTWPKGEKMIFHAFQELQKDHDFVLILAPHEINDHRIAEWEKQFPEISIRFSQIAQLNSQHRILWIDNIGMLSRLYHYGDLAYIGGGWGSGLHNILEAVVFGLPVIFGPQIQKFPEAGDLIVAGGGFAVSNQDEFTRKVKTLIEDKQLRESISVKNIAFIENKAGATQKIMDWLTTAGKKI